MLLFQFNLSIFFFFSILSPAFAIPTQRSSPLTAYAVLEQITTPPNGWTLNGTADPNHQITMFVALRSNDIEGLEQALYNISTPGSANYGKHLTKEQVEEFAAPSEETTTAVKEWLASNGIQATNASSSGEWLSFNITVAQSDEMFKTDYRVYTQESSGKQAVQSLTVSVPAHLIDNIDVVHPTSQFPYGIHANLVAYDSRKAVPHSVSSPISPRSVRERDSSPAACQGNGVTPDCILALYGIPPTVGPQNASHLAVSGFNNQFPQAKDLQLFLSNYRKDLDSSTVFNLEVLDGGKDPQNEAQAGGEANLDIQYTVGVAGGVPTTFITVGNDVPKGNVGGFTGLIIGFLGLENPPQVLTTSYSSDERDVSPSLAQKFCNSAMQLTARGVSVLFSSGDGGVGGGAQGTNCNTFVPTFPAGCPFITSVGATKGIVPETSASLSSGGFSNLFATPLYQKSAVDTYLKKIGNTNAGLFNTTGRAFPDVSAQGNNLIVIDDEKVNHVAGTSASVPIVAAFVASVNALRLQEGKSTLGFLNPLIYANPGLFTDIVSGNNPGCGTNGFPATDGWDPLTGMGTLNFDKFKALP